MHESNASINTICHKIYRWLTHYHEAAHSYTLRRYTPQRIYISHTHILVYWLFSMWTWFNQLPLHFLPPSVPKKNCWEQMTRVIYKQSDFPEIHSQQCQRTERNVHTMLSDLYWLLQLYLVQYCGIGSRLLPSRPPRLFCYIFPIVHMRSFVAAAVTGRSEILMAIFTTKRLCTWTDEIMSLRSMCNKQTDLFIYLMFSHKPPITRSSTCD